MKTLLKSLAAATSLAAIVIWAGCSGEGERDAEPAEPQETAQATPAARRAVATVTALNQRAAAGRVQFRAVEGGVQIDATITNLAPGTHGFHIHEIGECAGDGSSAGGHYNPTGTPHGPPDAPAGQRHVGDLGNLESNAQRIARYKRLDTILTLDGPDTIIGRAVIIHSGPDDLTSQPSGAAGERVACGVIRVDTGG